MGYVEISADPADKRAKRVCRTARGENIRREIRSIIAEVQQRWCREVGPERYAVFHEVLRELATGS